MYKKTKKKNYKSFLSMFLAFALILSNFFGISGSKLAFAGSGTENDPYTVAEAMAVAQTLTTTTAAIEVSVEGYIVGFKSTSANTTPSGIILADASDSSETATNTIYIMPSSDEQNKTELNNWIKADKKGSKVKVTGSWRNSKDKALYGGNPPAGRSCIGTVKGKNIIIKDATPINEFAIKNARSKAKGDEVTVQGIVTFNDRNQTLYIQDNTAGIAISNYVPKEQTKIDDFKSIKAGNEIKVKGKRNENKGLIQVLVSEKVQIVKETAKIPSAKLTTIPEIKTGKYESQLVKIEGATLGKINAKGTTPITVGSESINVYYVEGKLPEGIKEGDKIDIAAVVGKFNKDFQLVGASAVITKSTTGVDSAPVITHTAIKEGNLFQDLKVTAQVTDDKAVTSVKLYYRTKGKTEYKTIAMNKGTVNEYSCVISKADLNKAGLQYYIEATDGTNTITSPEDKTKPYEVTISDEDKFKPEVTAQTPADNSSVGDNTKPTISAEYKDASGINKDAIKLFVDTKEVTKDAKIEDSKITYTPTADLAKGKHIVQLTVEDNSKAKNKADVTWSFVVGEEILKPFFGQLHSHTGEISDGQGTLEEAYAWARDNAKADYFAVTDHSNWFDNDVKGNINDGSQSSKWLKMHEVADKYNENSKFVAIAGYEMTWSGSTGGWGHINTFNTPGFETRTNKEMDLKKYYDTVAKQRQSISQLNHPGKTFGDFGDFAFYSPAADAVVNLIEVGNGEGPVRGSGYFPSYEYYTRALDKGWHVAPTNNQDNHKGKWVNANTARTVILAPELTRDAMYEAMRQKRVYSTEDENLKISYKVNGKPMGSMLGTPDKLNVEINIEDPDASEKIGEVSIIANGGTVVDTKNFDSNTATWNLTLDPQYSYYYVKVDEGDKDIAVTAPVWVGENTPAGLSKVEVSQDLVYTNTEIEVKATLFNNTDKNITNAKVEFFKDEINTDSKIGEVIIPSVGPTQTSEAVIKYVAAQKGDFKIYAKVELNVDGKLKQFTQSTALSVANKEDLRKVIIDGGHQNQYVSGDYAGKMLNITAMLKEKKCLVEINKDELTEEKLKDVSLLILTDPQSLDDAKYKLTKTTYSDKEVEAIKNFTARGGNVILTSKADYKDGDGEYNNSVQGNKVLEAIGTNLRVNDDEVVDNTTNGGQAFRLAFDKFISSKYKLTDNVPEGQKYSFYSGCSVILKDKGDAANVDWIVKGHDTTESLDSDKAGDNVPVEKGNVYALGAEKLSSGAKVVVGGSTFFSDFELTGDNINANVQITKNILSWMLAKKGEVKTIREVRVDANKDGKPDNLGKTFTIEGIVTAQSEAVQPKNAFFEVIYVQDATGGITVFGVSKTPLKIGTKVRVIGFVDEYQGDAELQIKNETYDLEVLDTNLQPVEPKRMTTKASMLEENEGLLIKIAGKVIEIKDQNIYVDDGSGKARLYVEGYINDGSGKQEANGKWNPDIKVGDMITGIGLASEDPEGHRLRVRNTKEIMKLGKFEITKVEYEKEFVLGGEAKVKLEVKNKEEKSQDATLIVALYGENNQFVNFSFGTHLLEQGETAKLTAGFKLPEQGKYTVKAFVWDSFENMIPLSDVIEIPVK